MRILRWHDEQDPMMGRSEYHLMLSKSGQYVLYFAGPIALDFYEPMGRFSDLGAAIQAFGQLTDLVLAV